MMSFYLISLEIIVNIKKSRLNDETEAKKWNAKNSYGTCITNITIHTLCKQNIICMHLRKE